MTTAALLRHYLNVVQTRLNETAALMKTEILSGVRSGGKLNDVRTGTVPNDPFPVQVNPTPSMLQAMVKQSAKHSVRVLVSGENIATVDAWLANHGDIWQTLYDAGHPMATHAVKRIAWGEGGGGGWRIEQQEPNHLIVVDNASFLTIPEAQWPLGLKRALDAARTLHEARSFELDGGKYGNFVTTITIVPTFAQIKRLIQRSRRQQLRGIAVNDEFFVWDAFDVPHFMVRSAMDEQDGADFFIYGKLPIEAWQSGLPSRDGIRLFTTKSGSPDMQAVNALFHKLTEASGAYSPRRVEMVKVGERFGQPRGHLTEVMVNPSTSDVAKLLVKAGNDPTKIWKSAVRVIATSEDFAAWDANDAPHTAIGRALPEFNGMRPHYYVIQATDNKPTGYRDGAARYRIGRFTVVVLGRHGSALTARDTIQPGVAAILGPPIATLREADLPKAREFRATPDLLSIAVADTKASPHRHDMETDAHGVVVGGLRRLDRMVTRGDHTLDDVAQGWTKTHDFIRAKYGERVILYRADAPAKEHNPGTLTLYFASKKMADRYNAPGRVAKPYFVNTADIVAVHARENGYYEVIVRRPKEGLVPIDPTKLTPIAAPTLTEAVDDTDKFWIDTVNRLLEPIDGEHETNPPGNSLGFNDAIEGGWVRGGVHDNTMYLTARDRPTARRAIQIALKLYEPEEVHLEIEGGEFLTLDRRRAAAWGRAI